MLSAISKTSNSSFVHLGGCPRAGPGFSAPLPARLLQPSHPHGRADAGGDLTSSTSPGRKPVLRARISPPRATQRWGEAHSVSCNFFHLLMFFLYKYAVSPLQLLVLEEKLLKATVDLLQRVTQYIIQKVSCKQWS